MTLKSNSAFLAGNDRFEGYLADILRLLATSVGFDYEIRLSRDGKHGDLHQKGMWDGMIGDVQRGVRSVSSLWQALGTLWPQDISAPNYGAEVSWGRSVRSPYGLVAGCKIFSDSS